jgi:hypothetical protein
MAARLPAFSKFRQPLFLGATTTSAAPQGYIACAVLPKQNARMLLQQIIPEHRQKFQ